MAIGKGSLDRVANATVIGAPSEQTVEKTAPNAPSKKTAPAVKEKKTAPTPNVKRLGNVFYAVGDTLPEYLL